MNLINQIHDTKYLNLLLKEVLINNETEHNLPELTREIPRIIDEFNHYPVTQLMPSDLIQLLNTAFKNYYTNEVNGWKFNQVYTRNELDRIEFKKIIPNNKLSTYLLEYKQQFRFKETIKGTLQSSPVFGLELNYQENTQNTELTISTLVKTQHKKGFERYLI